MQSTQSPPKTLNPTKRKEPVQPCKTNPLQWNGSINSEMIALATIHNEKDLAISISIEAAELLEIFQWKHLKKLLKISNI